MGALPGTGTCVSPWASKGAVCECLECAWIARALGAEAAIRAAREHVLATGHVVDIASRRERRVTPVAFSDGFEAMGVPEAPNEHELKVWRV
jgi:hypothetical protein